MTRWRPPDACVPSPEVGDGLDNDCNGVVDNDVTDDERQCLLASRSPFVPGLGLADLGFRLVREASP